MTLATLVLISPLASSNSIEQCARLLQEHTPTPPATDEDVAECAAPVTLPSLSELCPEQVAALLAHPWSAGLARSTEELVLADLSGLDLLQQRYAARDPVLQIDTGAVADVLASLDQPPPQQPSWWDLAWRALLKWFRDEEPQLPHWFENVSISEFAIKAIMYTAMALIVLTALIIIGAEIRLGLAGRRRFDSALWDETTSRQSPVLDFGQIAGAPLREQPGLLLRLILERLRSAKLVNVPPSCTHRELSAATSALPFGSGMGQLCSSAERATFGNWQPDTQEMGRLFETCRSVCRGIEGVTR